ncbi:hypothetical protein [Cyanobium sp. LEGE 06113]|uniref:hypothetical protein n=1 Tax=Cyanobium sp. LEGE 06113 TaxID=1297573 RepID=UPI001880520A|nr:hypothetical protein [Cyanobium sp. LEGE 06113]MBE9154295.1 hypothetical protein [Cyanobium sp. LEGE 06113]
MVFKRKGSFFLDLTGAGDTKAEPVQVAITEAPPASSKGTSTAEVTAAPEPVAAAAAASTAPPAATPPSPAGSPLTTAEAIAAELRAAQEALPPSSQVTYAPDCLNPANALPMGRRRPGANLGVFKGMVSEMFRN